MAYFFFFTLSPGEAMGTRRGRLEEAFGGVWSWTAGGRWWASGKWLGGSEWNWMPKEEGF